MKKLHEYTGNLRDYSESEQKEILNTFINGIILDFNVVLREPELNHIRERVYENINKRLFIQKLIDIHKELIGNYRKYIPFCYASIVSASKQINK